MFVIGIDPHKGSHSAAVLDERARPALEAAEAPARVTTSGATKGMHRSFLVLHRTSPACARARDGS